MEVSFTEVRQTNNKRDFPLAYSDRFHTSLIVKVTLLGGTLLGLSSSPSDPLTQRQGTRSKRPKSLLVSTLGFQACRWGPEISKATKTSSSGVMPALKVGVFVIIPH